MQNVIALQNIIAIAKPCDAEVRTLAWGKIKTEDTLHRTAGVILADQVDVFFLVEYNLCDPIILPLLLTSVSG